MKKLYALLAIVFFSANLMAQGFKIGPKLGANISGNSGLQFEKGFNFGYHAGFFAEVSLTDKLGLQPEVLWSQVNLKSASSLDAIYSPSLGQLQDIRLSYLSIPLLLNIKPVKFITLQVGPQYGILVDKTKSFTSNAQSAFKGGDFSMVGGVQLKVLSFRVYGRYGIGLNSINDLPTDDKWKSKTLQLGVGLAL
ncbi:MAG: hypothetical protein RLY85_2298 [Bacteroidota bacterium]|jgi:hypothetical protein